MVKMSRQRTELTMLKQAAPMRSQAVLMRN
jgi:hypothetical protein